jgi:uncharacterized membrane-anchored protein
MPAFLPDQKSYSAPSKSQLVLRKLPHVTALFWMIKIIATTLGETAGDLFAQTLRIGYLVSTIILMGLFLIAVVVQLRARRFHPAIFWTVVALTSTVGTTLSDLMNRTGGLGYTGGALVLSTGLAIVFVVWWRSGQTLDVENLATFKGEVLFWIAILFSNSLGTSSGDFLGRHPRVGFSSHGVAADGGHVGLDRCALLHPHQWHAAVLDRFYPHASARNRVGQHLEQGT